MSSWQNHLAPFYVIFGVSHLSFFRIIKCYFITSRVFNVSFRIKVDLFCLVIILKIFLSNDLGYTKYKYSNIAYFSFCMLTRYV
jgi:hypothetical protein